VDGKEQPVDTPDTTQTNNDVKPPPYQTRESATNGDINTPAAKHTSVDRRTADHDQIHVESQT
jgi:hypothetical protein